MDSAAASSGASAASVACYTATYSSRYPIKLATSITGAGRAAIPTCLQVATIGSMRPVDLRFDSFRFPALSISTRQLAAAIFNTG